MLKYGRLTRDTWSIIINFLPEKYWKNIKCLNKSFESLIKSDVMIKKQTEAAASQSFNELCKNGYIESLLIFMKKYNESKLHLVWSQPLNWNVGLSTGPAALVLCLLV